MPQVSRVTLYQYRIYCETESKWRCQWRRDTPTVCPFNSSHTVNANSHQQLQEITADALTEAHSPYRAKRNAICVNTTGGDVTINLKPADRRSARNPLIILKDVSAGTVSVCPKSGDTIDGSSACITLTGFMESVQLQSDRNSAWTVHAPDDAAVPPINTNTDTINELISDSRGQIFVDDGNSLTVLDVSGDGTVLTSSGASSAGLEWTFKKQCISLGDNPDNARPGGDGIFRVVASVVYPGSASLSVISNVLVCTYQTNDATSHDIRLVDKTHNTVLGTASGLTHTAPIITDMIGLSNIPSGASELELHVRTNGGSGSSFYHRSCWIML